MAIEDIIAQATFQYYGFVASDRVYYAYLKQSDIAQLAKEHTDGDSSLDWNRPQFWSVVRLLTMTIILSPIAIAIAINAYICYNRQYRYHIKVINKINQLAAGDEKRLLESLRG